MASSHSIARDCVKGRSNLGRTTCVWAVYALFATACLGCCPIEMLNVKASPELLSALVCEISAHDPDDPLEMATGAAVCARTRAGQYIVITARHLAFAASRPDELEFDTIDPLWGNSLGRFRDLKPYIAAIHDLPELDLTIYILNRPIEDVPFVEIASAIPNRAKVTAFGTYYIDPTYWLALHKLQGTLDAVSADHKALSLVLHAHHGDSGGGVFVNGRLIGIVISAAPEGSPRTMRAPFTCTFTGRETIFHCDLGGILLKGDTTAIAITEAIVADAINRPALKMVPCTAGTARSER